MNNSKDYTMGIFGGLAGGAEKAVSERDVRVRAAELEAAGMDRSTAQARAREQLATEAANAVKAKKGYKEGGMVRGQVRMYGRETANPMGGK